jgi:glycosyltransferase involved in cell wall biosynthesis
VKRVHFVVPNDIHDPNQPSGGNTYDVRVCAGLVDLGWSVPEHAVPGTWPVPEPEHRAGLARVLAALPDDAVVVVDGLIASAVPDVLVPQARRLRLVVLVHMPLAGDAERAALASARAVLATSEWTRGRLAERYGLAGVHVATPGVDAVPLALGSEQGRELLCVAAVTRPKGHDLLADALAKVADLPWTCTCAGPLDRDPDFVAQLRGQIQAYGLDGRVRLVGSLTRNQLDAAYASADLLVLASRGETYAMVVTEALARGIPVLATATGGVPEAMGHAPDGSLPGTLVAPNDPTALASALRSWLTGTREKERQAALRRRITLTGWDVTARRVSGVLERVAA